MEALQHRLHQQLMKPGLRFFERNLQVPESVISVPKLRTGAGQSHSGRKPLCVELLLGFESAFQQAWSATCRITLLAGSGQREFLWILRTQRRLFELPQIVRIVPQLQINSVQVTMTR